LQGEQLVFVEVKSRFRGKYAKIHLFDNLTYAKQKKLRILAEIFINRNFTKPPPHRIDVVGVLVDRDDFKRAEIKHLVAVV
jgi:Holliday junction resolvase-like predicted endonuclease